MGSMLFWNFNNSRNFKINFNFGQLWGKKSQPGRLVGILHQLSSGRTLIEVKLVLNQFPEYWLAGMNPCITVAASKISSLLQSLLRHKTKTNTPYPSCDKLKITSKPAGRTSWPLAWVATKVLTPSLQQGTESSVNIFISSPPEHQIVGGDVNTWDPPADWWPNTQGRPNYYVNNI